MDLVWKLTVFCSCGFFDPLICVWKHQGRSFCIVLAGWGLHGKSSWAAGRGVMQHPSFGLFRDGSRSIRCRNMLNKCRKHCLQLVHCQNMPSLWGEELDLGRRSWTLTDDVELQNLRPSPGKRHHRVLSVMLALSLVESCADWMRIDYMLLNWGWGRTYAHCCSQQDPDQPSSSMIVFFTNNFAGYLRALSILSVYTGCPYASSRLVLGHTGSNHRLSKLKQVRVFCLFRRRDGRQCRVSSWSPVHVAFPELKT